MQTGEKNNMALPIIVGVSCFLVGAIISGSMIYWSVVTESFYKMRLIEVAQLAVTIVAAIFITYYVQARIKNKMKKKEVFIDYLTQLQNHLQTANAAIMDYVHSPKQEKEKKVLHAFKDLSAFLGIISEIKRSFNGSFDEKELVIKLFKFKEAATDLPFKGKAPKYDDETVLRIQSAYNEFIKELYIIKLKIYSE